ncbi:hypothetical protein [Roseibium sp. RKSG952]|uniref:hypothetical protein n=1 Tax=Roseibium sp. RKSG952 TaxID=2529384 RepID=UPI0012BD36DA|nr:hypothetical protein [Roseibium sp. RKSG952]MTH94897.1 hypothetical protein [Roseibium sp. RKSG952]
MNNAVFKYDPAIYGDLFDEDDCRKAEFLVCLLERWGWMGFIHIFGGPFRTSLSEMYAAVDRRPRVKSAVLFNPHLNRRYVRAHRIRRKSFTVGMPIYFGVFFLSYLWSFWLYRQGVPVPAEWTPLLVMFLIGWIADRFAVRWETRRIEAFLDL